jgi:hypothetical protein
VILIKSFVADYCNKSNRHQEKTMPETVFVFYNTLTQQQKINSLLNKFQAYQQ